MQYYSLSIIGPRLDNQDSLLVSETNDGVLGACMADGVGGNVAGSAASKMAVELALQEIINNRTLSKELFEKIDASIKNASNTDPSLLGMATTLSACMIIENQVFIGHTGDSRIMLLRNNGIKQLTKDHTEVERLITQGILTREDAVTYPRKHVIDSALGANKELLYFSSKLQLATGDRLILTTDGVHGVFSKREIRDISLVSDSPEKFISNIINAGLERRATDNASLIVIDI